MATKTKQVKIVRVTAKDAKNRFGELLEAAQRHPIIVTKNNRAVVRIDRYSEKTAFEEMEDQIWGEIAHEAEKEGYLSPEESQKALKRMLRHAKART
ncbi:type II toxin-antitoxin system prevent-host-death family antitoxin [Candidatus Parcubacteria bacterium]|nr:MAG: type II toxin-antitoxin system prevent-host-death family antitoxin [Candidatus Parcubacteria bacterium]